jgi:tetratricopeptide (TPR) repeat protein
VAEQALLVDLLILRGDVLGRIADYEQAAGLAELLVCAAPDDGAAWLARARTRATFHRFAKAFADLDAAGRCGADQATLDAERAAILQAVGCYAEALVLRRTAAERRPDFTTLGALAVLEAEGGEVAQAERLFTEARRRYRGVSPFPVASLDFRRGLMWLGQRDLPHGPCLVRRRCTAGAGLRSGAGSPCRGRRGPGRPGRRHRPPAPARGVQR